MGWLWLRIISQQTGAIHSMSHSSGHGHSQPVGPSSPATTVGNRERPLPPSVRNASGSVFTLGTPPLPRSCHRSMPSPQRADEPPSPSPILIGGQRKRPVHERSGYHRPHTCLQGLGG